jgi:hypothetical protein
MVTALARFGKIYSFRVLVHRVQIHYKTGSIYHFDVSGLLTQHLVLGNLLLDLLDDFSLGLCFPGADEDPYNDHCHRNRVLLLCIYIR